MQILNIKDSDFNIEFNELLNRGNMDIESVSNVVKDILNDIKANGDSAILSHIARFDHWNPSSFDDIMVDKNLLQQAYNGLSKELKNALKTAFDRITAFHMKQKSKSWIDFEDNGTMLGVKVTPINRAGLYIPGGKAAYPSSLLMNAIPAIVAGVKEIIVCTPTPNNEPSKLLLAAAHICGLDSVYKVGGASAIGLMAYGSENLKKVDVITGPGNIYVATAKKLVFGDVNIDMIAGPSEIGIIADKNANPTYIALDLLSQAEHDEMASSILITNDNDLAHKVRNEIEIELKKLIKYYSKNFSNFNSDFFLFGGNKPISCTTLERKKNKYCKLANVKQIRIHDFRHSHATMLYRKKIDFKSIQTRLGHANISTTLDTYVHTNDKEEKRLINKINLTRI